ncbi:MAG TPA: radical SAM family heme chaperone HemW [Euzebyales bacterium]|nr:radical SAM family heme chaperone HemW [Euzebyales bacterium]
MGGPAAGTVGNRRARARTAGAGIYLHVPFCWRRCHYCDFNTYADRDALIPDYVVALHADVDAVADAGPAALAPPHADVDVCWPTFDSLFIGGGTPTLVPAADLAGVVRHVVDRFPLAEDAEVTVEANPETVDVVELRALAGAGVNRVSIGAQSFVPHVLDALGRWHELEAPLRAVDACRWAGIDNVSLDLIYGTPGESSKDWEHSVRTALDTGIGHLSAYALTVEPSTEYARRVRLGIAAAPDDDVQAERMEQVDAWAADAGLARYELSNWAWPGKESVHNRLYWRGGDWLGIGAGAHGHWQGRRWWTVRTPERYVRAALDGGSPVAGFEVTDDGQRRAERLMMGLRLTEGVGRAAVAPLDDRVVADLVAAGLLRDDPERLVLTSDGMRLASSVTLQLL